MSTPFLSFATIWFSFCCRISVHFCVGQLAYNSLSKQILTTSSMSDFSGPKRFTLLRRNSTGKAKDRKSKEANYGTSNPPPTSSSPISSTGDSAVFSTTASCSSTASEAFTATDSTPRRRSSAAEFSNELAAVKPRRSSPLRYRIAQTPRYVMAGLVDLVSRGRKCAFLHSLFRIVIVYVTFLYTTA
jgi:hypothetical protein